MNFTIHLQLTQAASNQLCILRTKIQYPNTFLCVLHLNFVKIQYYNSWKPIKLYICAPYLGVSGCSVARLSRLVWDQEVASSNLATPTSSIHKPNFFGFFYFIKTEKSISGVVLNFYREQPLNTII